MPATPLIGREDELDRVESFLDGIAEGPSALVLSGEAGIGKTSLWEAGVDEAHRRQVRVLSCRGVEVEAALSFAVLSELLADVLDETLPSLPTPRRRALEVALLLAEPGDHSPDAYAIGLAVLDVLRVLAESGPLLAALDDAQWLDPSSAGALQIAFRRLRDEPVGMLATVRRTPDVPIAFELKDVFPEERLGALRVGPLSAGAVHRLLEERLGLDLTRPELSRVQEATAGNPFFALELGRELVRTGTRPSAGQALPVPESLQELLGDRLSRLPSEAGDIVLFAAALARPTVEAVTAANGDRERVVEAVDIAAQEGVIELDGTRIRFAHPLVASICYERAQVWKRRAVHQALAHSVEDVEERARHLALAANGPDETVAAELDAASEQAEARGAPAAGAELAQLAAQLTPDDAGPSGRRRLRAAHLLRIAGSTLEAERLLEELLPDVPGGTDRADVLLELALTQRLEAQRALALCTQALDEADDDERAVRILTFRSISQLIAADVPAALHDARSALAKAERLGDPEMLARAIARAGTAEVYAAEVTPGLLERGAELEERLGLELEYFESPGASLARLLERVGDLDRARSILGRLEAKMEARGDEIGRCALIFNAAVSDWLAGDWRKALERSGIARELAEQLHNPWLLGQIGRVTALIEVDLGLVDQARASCEEALATARAHSSGFWEWWTQGVAGRLELLLGNLDTAAELLRNLPAQLIAAGLHDPANPVWADAVETLVAVGDLERARSYLTHYSLYAQRFGSPWAEGGSARCRGLLAAADGDTEAAFAAFDEALSQLGRFPLERGRTLLCLGTVRRQAQQKKVARDALEQALVIFEELGARLWAEKARAELARISGRAPSSDDLTETERRVAELAAQGRTNREIAAELFMGVSTVESHLSHVYRKLGVRRAELAASLERAEA